MYVDTFSCLITTNSRSNNCRECGTPTGLKIKSLKLIWNLIVQDIENHVVLIFVRVRLNHERNKLDTYLPELLGK